jgi:hypothetical protein
MNSKLEIALYVLLVGLSVFMLLWLIPRVLPCNDCKEHAFWQSIRKEQPVDCTNVCGW